MLVLLCAAVAFPVLGADDYQEVTHKQLEVSPKDFRGKRVTYTARFLNPSANIPTYMQWNNIKPDKYVLISAGSNKMPVVIRKSDAVTELLVSLQKGDTIKVSGQVKEFSVKPRHAMLPYYYLEADTIEKVDAPASEGAGEKPALPPRLKGRIRRRL
jgi:hypothetical protein